MEYIDIFNENNNPNPLMIALAIGITAILMILTIIHYEKKELV